MGIVQKDALRTTALSYLGLILGYINKGVLFILFLSTEEIGLINLVIAVSLLFARLSNIGTVNSIWKFFPFFQDREKKNKGFLLYILSIVGIGAAIFSLIILVFQDLIQSYYVAKSPQFIDYYYWIIPIGIANLLFLTFESYLRSMYKNTFVIFANEVLYRLLTTLFLVFLGLELINFQQFIIIFFCLSYIPTILLVIYTSRIGELHLKWKDVRISGRFKKIILNYTFFGYLNTIGANLVISIDVLMVASLIGLKSTGIYTTILYLTAALSIPYRSISRVSAPLIAENWKRKDMIAMKSLYQKVSSVSFFVGICLFMLVWINRVEIFSLLPQEFSAGIYVFLFLMLGRLVDFYGGVNGQILVTSKKYKSDIYFTLFLLVTVAVLNYILIPIYGMVGAAISTATSIFLYNLGRLVFVQKVFKINPFSMKQVLVLMLFGLNFILFETIFNFENYQILGVIIKSALFVCTFALPIYLFKLEPNTVDYINKILVMLKIKEKA